MSIYIDIFNKLDSELTFADIVKVDIKDHWSLVVQNASAAEIGGRSQFRGSQERTQHLREDQICGQLGELAGNLQWFSAEHYRLNRESRNLNPTIGDNGCDTLGYRIDYKASLAKKEDLLSYNLVVRPHERHKNHIYVLVLVKATKPTPEVYLMGWASEDMLPSKNQTKGVFGPTSPDKNDGAYILPATRLRKISELKTNDIPRC